MSRGELAEFDETNFEGSVLERPGLTVVDFWSSTCAPCRQLTKILSQLQPDLPANVVIGKVNADDNSDLVDRFAVRTLPTLLFVKDGEVVASRTGVDRRQVLKKLIEDHA